MSARTERDRWQTSSSTHAYDRLKRFMPGILLLAWAAVAIQLPAPAEAAVSFSTPDRLLPRDPAAVQPDRWLLNVVVRVENGASLPATGWGMVMQITPLPGATGSIQFDPPAIVNDEPNLNAATVNPFLDFDRDFGGMSYGMLGDSSTELQAVSAYMEPRTAPPPPLDSNGNLTLPNGSELVALPIQVSAGTAGDFALSFGTDPAWTGVTYATGLAPPNDAGIHPVAAHGDATLTVMLVLPGDYNGDGVVDGTDLPVWEATFGTIGNNPFDGADGDGDRDVDGRDFLVWQRQLNATAATAASSTVPEPSTCVVLLVAWITTLLGRANQIGGK